jgi:hypothetical protein
VEVLRLMLPIGVTDDGNRILCGMNNEKDNKEEEEEEESSSDGSQNASTVKVTDVSIVIFCTGYNPNMDFLDTDLKSWWWPAPAWSLPDGWRMEKKSPSAALGTVKPSTELKSESICVFPGPHRQHVLIHESQHDVPLRDELVSAIGHWCYRLAPLGTHSRDHSSSHGARNGTTEFTVIGFTTGRRESSSHAWKTSTVATQGCWRKA